MKNTRHHNCNKLLAKARDLEKRGNLDDARKVYRDILERWPSQHQALTCLALIEYRGQRFDAAIDLLRRAAAARPDDYDVLLSLGVSYRAAARIAEAIPCFEKIIQLRPHDLQGYANLAAVHQQSHQLPAALQTWNRAKQLKLFDANAQCQYARVLEQLAENDNDGIEDVIQAYRTGISMNPANPEPAARLALFLERINRIDDAVQTAHQALALQPDNPWLLLALAKCHYRQKRYAEGIACLSGVNLTACPPQLQMLIAAELGVLHDKEGTHDRAYEYLVTSNRQAKMFWDSFSKEQETYIQRVEKLLRQAERIENTWSDPTTIDDGNPDPVFLIGFPRSGTTLLDQILDSHPGIYTLEEIPVFDLILERTGNLGGRYPMGLEQLSIHEIKGLRAAYFEEVSRHVEYRRDALFVDKLPLNTWNVLLIKRLFPNARFILAIRHPCDVCLSCFMQNFDFGTAMASFYSLESAARLYDLVMRLWSRYEHILDLNYHMTRYEDVVADLEAETRRLLTFLDLDWNENMRHFDKHARERLSINTPSYRQVRQPIYRSSLYRWHNYQRYFAPLLPLLRPHIERFGYREDT